jgi:hypothetical protein
VPVFTHWPEQHCALVKHTSFVWMQNETAALHVPAEQNPEQQSVLPVQPLPCVRQPPPGLIGAHLLFVQIPLQQSAFVPHAPATGLSGTHAFVVQRPVELQRPLQQFAPVLHVLPFALHAVPPPGTVHTFAVTRPQTPPFGQGDLPTPHWRRPPQPSGTKPHERPLHATAWVVGVHDAPPPQTDGVPPPPHVLGETQFPHAIVPPQPSAIGPHAPVGQVVFGVHVPVPPSPPPLPQTLPVPPPPHVEPAGQAPPQLIVLPQPSAMLPQFWPAGHVVFGVQVGEPHWFATPPPPQIAPLMHLPVPQSMTPPQPSATFPHSNAPHEATVRGVHVPPPPVPSPPQMLGIPPPPQIAGATQPVPHDAVTSPQPSGIGPQLPG